MKCHLLDITALVELESFPAEEGYGMQRISIRESCHVFLVLCQLETIDKDVIYKQVDGIFWEQSLNCLVELKGTHRYKNCPVNGARKRTKTPTTFLSR
jgi:hypothetical protein